MQTETFIDVQEIEHIETEQGTEEYNQLCIDLGLENLAVGPDTQVNGLQKMSEIERKVYSYLMPTKCTLKEYQGLVPTRILEAYKKCKENNWLEGAEVFIWTAEELDDPIMVAKMKYNDFRLIGRWGEELRSFAELKQIAIENKLADLGDDIAKMRSYLRLYDESPKQFAQSAILDKFSSFYW